MIQVEAFLTIANDNDVTLSLQDQLFIKQKLSVNGKINYEDIIRDLALIAYSNNSYDQSLPTQSFHDHVDPPQLKWILRSNHENVGQDITKNIILQNSLAPPNPLNIKMKFKASSSLQRPKSFKDDLETLVKQDSKQFKQSLIKEHDDQSLPQINNSKQLNMSANLSTGGSPRKQKQEIMNNYIKDYNPEMQKILSHILLIKKDKYDQNEDNMKYISAGSKQLNILKNKQNRIYIKSSVPTEKLLLQKQRIRKYMKENDVDISHLNSILSAFLDCDENRTGLITKKQLFEEIYQQKLQFPPDFLFNLIHDIQVNQDDESDEATLSYSSLRNIVEIYSNLPLFVKQYYSRLINIYYRGDSNNSDNFKYNLELSYSNVASLKQDRVSKLFKCIHNRVVEKFKDFRMGFRSMDKDFGGSIDFKEFIQGLENIGVKFKISDYRLVFETIDFDNTGIIDFYKFCLINTDKRAELDQLRANQTKNMLKQEASGQVSTAQGSRKPPLPPLQINGSEVVRKIPVFDDGHVPKNKDVNGFNKDVQKLTPTREFVAHQRVRKGRGIRSYQDLSSEHSFGLSNKESHDIVAILTNSYQEELNNMTLDTLKKSLIKKPLAPPKNTHAQEIRDKATRLRYTPLNRSSSLNSGIDPYTGLKNKRKSGTYSIPSKSSQHHKSFSALSVQGSNTKKH